VEKREIHSENIVTTEQAILQMLQHKTQKQEELALKRKELK
jgi:hypothetical protein